VVDWCIAMMSHNVMDCLDVDGRGMWSRLLGVKDRIIRSSVDDFSALSWESVGKCLC
jgi:hypothetical protein